MGDHMRMVYNTLLSLLLILRMIHIHHWMLGWGSILIHSPTALLGIICSMFKVLMRTNFNKQFKFNISKQNNNAQTITLINSEWHLQIYCHYLLPYDNVYKRFWLKYSLHVSIMSLIVTPFLHAHEVDALL